MLRGAFIGFGVALLMLLPPILHFVTGPLGPLVGGFLGGFRARASLARAVGVGFLMGLFMIAPVVALVAMGSVAKALLPPGVRDALVYVAIIMVAYTTLMGSIGAAIGGRLARQQAARDGASGSDFVPASRDGN